MRQTSHRIDVSLISALMLSCLAWTPVRGQAQGTASPPAPPMAAPAAPVEPPRPVVHEPGPRLRALLAASDPAERLDEALGGRTLRGTPVTRRIPECFPAERRDIFWEMDRVASGPNGELEPLSFDRPGQNLLLDGLISDEGDLGVRERDAIRGRNTWLLWGGGNEAFWGWLQEQGFGLTDFLILLDSRLRNSRFRTAGLINQPGMVSNSDPARRILGLYLDVPAPAPLDAKNNEKDYIDEAKSPIWLKQPDSDFDARGPDGKAQLAKRDVSPHPAPLFPTDGKMVPKWLANGDVEKDKKTEEDILVPLTEYVGTIQNALPKDGLDYDIYGYPSGIFGLRLFLNPDFFGNTEAAEEARRYWNERVVRTNGRYYSDPSIHADPSLVRPFRVSMSCGFCHVGPHPLCPPKDPENPEWRNLSSTIGNQYWKPQAAFGNLLRRNSFLYHFLASQQPGTIDTSLVSTDHINNANTINAVFDIPARLARAGSNPPEDQSLANLRLPSIEDHNGGVTPRHTPRVLVDGSDSIGAFGALARVCINIGTFSEQWATCHNPLIGFKPQRPFTVEVCQRNSVYWMTNEKYRTAYLAAFFTFRKDLSKTSSAARGNAATAVEGEAWLGSQSATGPMKLRDAKDLDSSEPPKEVPSEAAAAAKKAYSKDQRVAGRRVWIGNCAICHSSKQPPGFALDFSRSVAWKSWADAPAPQASEPARYTLPMDDMQQWEAFKRSPAYKDYLSRLGRLIDAEANAGLKDATEKWKLRGQKGSAPVLASLEDDPWDADHPFWVDNYLSTDIRVPITLVGTNSARAMATNALRGQVWDNFSSDTYKALPAVGKVRYFNPFSNDTADDQGTNAEYDAPGGGRGYYRPATHIGLWATAPFLHNNSLGLYNHDPSVAGRVTAFEDAMRRMLWKTKRSISPLQSNSGGVRAPDDTPTVVTHIGDLRVQDVALRKTEGPAARDPGYIYRLPQDTFVSFAPGYARPLVEGVAGPFLSSVLTFWGWLVLFLTLVLAAWKARARYAGIVCLILAGSSALVLAASGAGGGGGTTVGAVLMSIGNLLELSGALWWLVAVFFGCIGLTLMLASETSVTLGRWLVGAAVLAVAFAVWRSTESWWGTAAELVVGIWAVYRSRWTPNRFARAVFIVLAVVTLAAGWTTNRFINGKVILHIPAVNVTIGPFPVKAGPFPRGMPVNLMMSLDPTSEKLPKALVSAFEAIATIKKKGLAGEAAWQEFSRTAGQNLLDASKCPDFVLDRGHLFGEALSDADKEALIAFLTTL